MNDLSCIIDNFDYNHLNHGAVVKRLSLLHGFIPELLNACFEWVQILPAVCPRFEIVTLYSCFVWV